MSWFRHLFPKLGHLTDEQVMWRVQTDDDPAAFAELARRWQGPLHRLCVRMTGDEHRGEDLAQETLVRVFANRHRFQLDGRFATWLWRIALNLCHDERRRVARRAEAPLDTDDDDDRPGLRVLEPGPDERVAAQERAALVREAVLSLPETHRAVLVLKEYEGLKLREIAEVLGIPEGTVKSRLADALTRLARRLKPMLTEEISRPAAAPARTKEGIVL